MLELRGCNRRTGGERRTDGTADPLSDGSLPYFLEHCSRGRFPTLSLPGAWPGASWRRTARAKSNLWARGRAVPARRIAVRWLLALSMFASNVVWGTLTLPNLVALIPV